MVVLAPSLHFWCHSATHFNLPWAPQHSWNAVHQAHPAAKSPPDSLLTTISFQNHPAPSVSWKGLLGFPVLLWPISAQLCFVCCFGFFVCLFCVLLVCLCLVVGCSPSVHSSILFPSGSLFGTSFHPIPWTTLTRLIHPLPRFQWRLLFSQTLSFLFCPYLGELLHHHSIVQAIMSSFSHPHKFKHPHIHSIFLNLRSSLKKKKSKSIQL